MTRSVRLLLLAVLTAAALMAAPPRASAIDVCAACQVFGDCYACCRCDGHTGTYCEQHCPS